MLVFYDNPILGTSGPRPIRFFMLIEFTDVDVKELRQLKPEMGMALT